MKEQVIIPAQFSGPPDSANGGFACGVVAGLLSGPAEVTLRRPPPLDTPMEAFRPGDELVEIHDVDGVVAEGIGIDHGLVAPPPVDFDQAVRAAVRYRGFDPGATFVSCFVCSPERQDGLRIFPGPVNGSLAAPWIPDPSLTDSEGSVMPEIVWAALDCPTFFASTEPGQLALLGRMAAELRGPARASEPHVVVAQPEGASGRKRFGSSALYSAGGELLAVAYATWITIDV